MSRSAPSTVRKSEFAKLAGVTKAAVSIALSRSRITAEPDGSIDPNRPENAAYLQANNRQRRQARRDQSRKNGRSEAQQPSSSSHGRKRKAVPGAGSGNIRKPAEINGETHTMAELRDKIAAANLKEQKLLRERGELVARKGVKLIFARLYSVHASQLKTLAEKLGPDVAAALGMKDQDTLRVQELMDLEVRRALAQIKREPREYLKSIGDGDAVK